MKYFDTDVIINAVVEQDIVKHQEAKELVFNALNDNTFIISTLVIQETGYALARIGLPVEEIERNLAFFSSLNVCLVEHAALNRGIELASLVGFKNMNDCIHTAVAESINCEQLFTYNQSDFKRIQKNTSLTISIL
ncbi:type II toxin-antitoxin system VapC family toxin [Larkinella bovis]|uniref:Type II toxin-antitoxin system VapC family toxin n=1 Tax=Larkinella bovis TaxID=683041 RepID=A0ABW0IBR9_9BACT